MAISKRIHPSPRAPLSPSEVMKQVSRRTITTAARKSLTGKRVTFAESKNVEYRNTVMNNEECKSLWYSAFDFQKIKDRTHQFAKQALLQDKQREGDDQSYSNIILRVYGVCCEADCDLFTTASSSQSCILDEEDENAFVFLIGKANSRAGLERVIVRDLACDKRFRRSEIVLSVLKLQQPCHNICSKYSVAELMRLTCESVSRPSRLFARQLGAALEASLRGA